MARVIVLDTSGLLAALDGDDPRHAESAAALRMSADARLLSPFVLAELDYLIDKRLGQAAQRAVLAEVARGAYRLEAFTAEDVAHIARIIDRYAGPRIGLADASVVALADRYEILDILTLDERHFRTLLGAGGRPFRLLPADR